jgi:hypothetical protein
MIPLLLATVLALQDPKPPAAEWRDVDGIVYVINEDIVTQRGFQKQLAQYLRKNPNSDPKTAQTRLSEDIVRGAVGSQAGEAMGIDANLVKRSVRDYERRLIDSKGGVDQYTASLAQDGMTAEDMRSDIEKYVLREMWESSRTGQGPNQQQKIIADRFVRPGTLRFTYTQITRNPAFVSRIGGDSSKVVLRILELDPARVGGTAQLETSAAAVRARIASGDSDFDVASASYGLASGSSRPTEPLDEARLAETDPDLARLVASAKLGEVLPVIPPHGTFKTWRIVRLEQRIPAHVPGFKSAAVQNTMRDLLQSGLDGRRLDFARKQQYESSYIWPSAPDGH